jgi:hypothetical protein
MAGRRRGKSGRFLEGRLSGGLHPGGPVRGFKRGAALTTSQTLGDTFTYNGQDAPAEFRFDGTEFPFDGTAFSRNWADEVSGTNLAAEGSSPAVTSVTDFAGANAPFFDGNGATFGERFVSGESDLGDVGTADFILEAIIRIPGAVSGVMVAKQLNNSNDGWSFRTNASNIYMNLNSPLGAVNILISRATFTLDEWNHFVLAIDRSGNGIMWCGETGVAQTAVVTGVADSMDNALGLAIGDFSSSTNTKAEFELAHTAMYLPSNLDLSSSTNLVAACNARYEAIGGTPGSTLGT